MAAPFGTPLSSALRNLLKDQKDAMVRLLNSQHEQLRMAVQAEACSSRAAPRHSGRHSDGLELVCNHASGDTEVLTGLVGTNDLDIVRTLPDCGSVDSDSHRRCETLPDVPDFIKPSTTAMPRTPKTFVPFGDEHPHGWSPNLIDPASSKLGHDPDLIAPTYAEEIMEPRPLRKTNVAGGLRRGGNGTFSRRKTMFFVNEADMKEDMKNAELAPDEDVTRFYKKHGRFQAIARSQYFEWCSFLLIGTNIIWIGIEADYNRASVLSDAPVVFQVFEQLFCMCFLIEICIRYGAFERTIDCSKDMWFMFDLLLVIVMVSEQWVLTLILMMTGFSLEQVALVRTIKIVRLTKCARLLRLMRSFPELMIMVKGIAAASRSAVIILSFLLIVLYIFGMIFMELFRGSVLEEKFPYVGESMWLLMVDGIFPDFASILNDSVTLGWQYGAIMVVFVVFSNLTVINLLIGVTCQIVDVVANVENEKNEITGMKDALLEISDWEDDECGDLRLSVSSFNLLLGTSKFKKICSDWMIDVHDVKVLSEDLYTMKDGEDVVSFYSFVDLLIQHRGSNHAKVKDLAHLRKASRDSLTRLDALTPAIQRLAEALSVNNEIPRMCDV